MNFVGAEMLEHQPVVDQVLREARVVRPNHLHSDYTGSLKMNCEFFLIECPNFSLEKPFYMTLGKEEDEICFI